ncbi:MAG: glycosyltransferase [Anaerolineales bacterium]|jgi:hypothetical protein
MVDAPSMPKVTVVMPVYNGERFLGQAIESILGQTYSNFELFIVDDASTDGSVDIIRSYQDARIRLIQNASNRGPAYSRNIALNQGRGQYAASLDADDVACLTRLQMEASYLDEHPDVALVAGTGEAIDETGRSLGINLPLRNDVAIRWRLLFRNTINGGTVMYRRALALQAGGYDERFTPAEDYLLWVKLAKFGSIFNLDEVLTRVRQNPRSLTHSRPIELRERTLSVVQRSVTDLLGFEVAPEVAAFLNGSSFGADRDVARNGYDVYWQCLRSFALRKATRKADRALLFDLVLQDLLVLGRECEAERGHALRIALLFGLGFSPSRLLTASFARFAARVVLAARVRRWFQHPTLREGTIA